MLNLVSKISKESISEVFTPGVRYMFLATLVFSGMHALVKFLAHFHVFEIVFFRSGITALMAMYLLKRAGIPFMGKNNGLLITRALAGVISMTLFFVTLQRMPIGAAVSLKYLAPIFTAIFAVLFLKERIKPVQWLFFFTAVGGVFLLKGFDLRIALFDLSLAVIGAVLGGLVYVLIRRIGEREHPLVIINYFMLLATILAGFGMIPYWETPSPKEWFLLVLVGILGFLGQLFMTKSLQVELASKVSQIKYMEVIYTLIIGWIWFGEGYTFLSFLGIALIIISMIMNVAVKRR